MLLFCKKLRFFITKWLIKVPFVYSNWPLVLADHFAFWFKSEYICKLYNGLKYYVVAKSSDINVLHEVYLSREYFYKNPLFNVLATDVVLDLGAYIGDFTVYAASKTTQGQIIAVEPVPRNLNQLRKNIKLNAINNVQVVSGAIGKETKKSAIYHDTKTVGATLNPQLLGNFSVTPDQKYDVDVYSPNDLFSKISMPITFIKMDIEGGEYVFFNNVDAKFLQNVRAIIIEAHVCASDDFKLLVETLKRLGFVVELKKFVDYFDVCMVYAYRAPIEN